MLGWITNLGKRKGDLVYFWEIKRNEWSRNAENGTKIR